MIYKVYAMRDKLLGFGVPVVDMNENSARRSFRLRVQNDSLISGAPADFDLYELGDYDSESGKVIGYDAPKFICNGEVYHEE